MKYLVSHFTIQCSDGEFMQPAREITAAIAGECGYETFLDTDDGIDGYVQVDLFHEPSVREALENFPMDGLICNRQPKTHRMSYVEIQKMRFYSLAVFLRQLLFYLIVDHR